MVIVCEFSLRVLNKHKVYNLPKVYIKILLSACII
nr:MAG TPA: hypothetical protein [Crassvirales sp.]